MKLSSYTLREMRRRPGRAILTLLGIVIGVTAITGVSITIESARQAHRDMFTTLTGEADLEVYAPGYGGFDPLDAGNLEAIGGVSSAQPAVQKPALILGSHGTIPVLTLGITSQGAGALELREGNSLSAENGILMEAGFAEASGLVVGNEVRLLATSGYSKLKLIGTLEPGGAASFNGGAVAFVRLETAQRLFRLDSQVNAIYITIEDTAAVDDVQAAVAKSLTPGLTVDSPAHRANLAHRSLHSTEQGLGVLSVVSLIAGAFVILNAFLMNLGERATDLAVMRSLGATRKQITGMLLREAALLGIIGTLIGAPLGLGLAAGMAQAIGQAMGVTYPGLHVTPGPFLAAFLMGPGVALCATYLPARRAGRRAPLENLTEAARVREQAARRWPGFLGLGMITAGVIFVFAIMKNWLPMSLILSVLPACMAMLCVSIVLVVPLILKPLASVVSKLMSAALGMEGRMAVRQLLRHPGRTGLTVGVLTISVMVAAGYGNTLITSVEDVRTWSRQIGNVDFFVRGNLPDPGTMSLTTSLPESLGAELAAIDGVDYVHRINFIPTIAAGEHAVLIAEDFTTAGSLRLDLAGEDPEQLRRELVAGKVVLGTALAQFKGLSVGDEVVIETPTGPQSFEIAALNTEYTTGGLNLGMDWQIAKRVMKLEGVHVFAVDATEGASAKVAASLSHLSNEKGLLLHSRADFQEMVDGYMEGVVASLFLIMGMVFLVALLGIVNTLSMNVLEQTREIGILRAVAMKRKQLRKMILGEAMSVGLISLVPGFVGGLGLSYLMNLSTYALTGFRVDFELETPLLAATLVSALVVSAIAALPPARRAAQLKIISALKYE